MSQSGAYVDNTPVKLDHGPTGQFITSTQADSNHNYNFAFVYSGTLPYAYADSILSYAGAHHHYAGGNPFYSFKRREFNLAASKALEPIYLMERFTESGSQAGYSFYGLLDWYFNAVDAGAEVNWTYPINVDLNSNDPNAGDYVAILTAALESWEACDSNLKGKLFAYSSATNGLILSYVSDPAKPCVELGPQVTARDSHGNLLIVGASLVANAACSAVPTANLINVAKHEIGHAIGFVKDDAESTHIMNPSNAANNPVATQSPVECKAAAARYGIPNGFDKSQWVEPNFVNY